MKIKPYFLSDSLTCIINQRLVKKLCPHCKKKLVVNNKQFIEAYFPVGCPACNNTGYKGRIMVYEILKVTNDVKEIIAKGATTLEIQKLIEEKGFRSITDNTKELVIEGITSIEEFNKIKYDFKKANYKYEVNNGLLKTYNENEKLNLKINNNNVNLIYEYEDDLYYLFENSSKGY